jgi:hypothetical protein
LRDAPDFVGNFAVPFLDLQHAAFYHFVSHMNIAQKVLTVLMLLVFTFFTMTISAEHEPPPMNYISAWVTIAVIYAGLFFVLASSKRK